MKQHTLEQLGDGAVIPQSPTTRSPPIRANTPFYKSVKVRRKRSWTIPVIKALAELLLSTRYNVDTTKDQCTRLFKLLLSVLPDDVVPPQIVITVNGVQAEWKVNEVGLGIEVTDKVCAVRFERAGKHFEDDGARLMEWVRYLPRSMVW